MSEKEILIGVLTKTLNKSEQEVTDLLYQKDGEEVILKEGVIDEVLSLDSVRVENIKKNTPIDSERLKNEFSRGKKEALDGLEKSLKEKYSIDSDKQGIELIDDVLASKSKPSKMSDDDVKKHPIYLELEKKRVPKEEYESLKKDYDDYKGKIELDKKFGTVKDRARTLLQELKPIVSENPTVAKTREEDFLRKFEAYDYQLDGDTPIVLKSDGTRMEDGHGNPLPFNDFVKNLAMMNYDFPKQDDKGNSGTDDKGKKPLNVPVPKDDKEYVQFIRDAKTPEEKIAIKEAFIAKQGK